MDADFRNTEMARVMDSVVEVGLGVAFMAIKEMKSMLVNFCATFADYVAVRQNWEEELDAKKQAEVWQWYAMIQVAAGHMKKPFTSVAFQNGRKDSSKIRCCLLSKLL